MARAAARAAAAVRPVLGGAILGAASIYTTHFYYIYIYIYTLFVNTFAFSATTGAAGGEGGAGGGGGGGATGAGGALLGAASIYTTHFYYIYIYIHYL